MITYILTISYIEDCVSIITQHIASSTMLKVGYSATGDTELEGADGMATTNGQSVG